MVKRSLPSSGALAAALRKDKLVKFMPNVRLMKTALFDFVLSLLMKTAAWVVVEFSKTIN